MAIGIAIAIGPAEALTGTGLPGIGDDASLERAEPENDVIFFIARPKEPGSPLRTP